MRIRRRRMLTLGN
jgi:hypothetical protein